MCIVPFVCATAVYIIPSYSELWAYIAREQEEVCDVTDFKFKLQRTLDPSAHLFLYLELNLRGVACIL